MTKKTEKFCKICGKQLDRLWGGMCSQHYQQMKRFGCIPERTERTPNAIVVIDDYADVSLYSDGEVVAKVKISLCDIEKVHKLKWSLDDGYARNSTTKLLMHRYIMDAPKGKEVDHINGDTLDNRRENLRVVSPFINSVNKTKTNQRGIDKYRGQFRARIAKDKKSYNLGMFKTHEEALIARIKGEIKHYGETYD